MSTEQASATVWIDSVPFSTDPIDYDKIAHHIAFRSVYSSIVSQYQIGKFQPILVENWSTSSTNTDWTIKIRSGLHFENGDPITATDIANSWLRAAHIMKSRKSHSGFFEKLQGYEHWKGLNNPLEGIQVSGQQISLKFETPFRNFLETASFGLYSVVHPSCYDSTTGEWKNPNCLISSGPYRISSWNKDELVLSLRADFPAPQRAIQKISIRWNEASRKNADLVVGFSLEENLLGREFYGTPQANIAYIRCNSWPNIKGPCGTVEKRRLLRTLFYEAFAKDQLLPDMTFFPLSIPGIKSFSIDSTLSASNFSPSFTYRISPLIHVPFKKYNQAFQRLNQDSAIKANGADIPQTEAMKEVAAHLKLYSFDINAQGTGILIESPRDDIRFMFLSKEGIQLPDTDGRITEELKKADFSPQKINELLWDQAVIWPLAHFSLGIWAKKNMFDFSAVNLSLPPTDFQFIRWK